MHGLIKAALSALMLAGVPFSAQAAEPVQWVGSVWAVTIDSGDAAYPINPDAEPEYSVIARKGSTLTISAIHPNLRYGGDDGLNDTGVCVDELNFTNTNS